MVLPDVSFRGKIDAEDLKDDTCAKEEDSRGEYSEVVVEVKENGNVENYFEKDYDDTGNMGDGSKDEEHQDGSSMEEMMACTREEDHEDFGSMEDDGTKEEDHEDGGSINC